MTSRISTLCNSRYMQVIKSLAHHLSGRLLRCTGGLYIEKSLTKKSKGGPQHARSGQAVALKMCSLRRV